MRRFASKMKHFRSTHYLRKKNNVRADVLRPLVQRTDFIIADFSAQEAVKGSLGRLLTQG